MTDVADGQQDDPGDDGENDVLDDPAWIGYQPRTELAGSEPIDMMVAHDLIGDVAHRLTSDGQPRWALRADGEGILKSTIDAIRLSELLGNWGRTIRWFSNTLFPTRGVPPGSRLATTGGSVIIEFTPGLHEEPIITRDGQEVWPTIVAAQYLAAMFRADQPTLDSLDERLGAFRGFALQAYASNVRYQSQHELEVDLIVPRPTSEGEFVMAEIPPERAHQEAVLLDRRPEMETVEEFYEGLLDEQSYNRHVFTLILDDGTAIRGTYPDDLRERLKPLWGEQVVARVEVTKAKQEWLPRASRVRPTYRLAGIRRA